MEGNLTFEFMFNNLLQEFREAGTMKEVASHFGPDKSFEEMFQYFWELPEAKRYLDFDLTLTIKSETEAEKLRAEGNNFYQKKKLGKALELYNRSIMAAPHPKIYCREKMALVDGMSEKESEKGYKALALGFSNRSAVLLELEQYGKCINDIDLALKYGYPKEQQSKLAERKAKCLMALHRQQDAEVLLKSAMDDLANMNLDDKKKQASNDTLNQLIQQCKTSEAAEKITEALKNKNLKPEDRLLFAYEDPPPPNLNESNPNIPCLSSALKLQYDSDKGRFLIADRDINPGELLLVEKAYSSCLLLEPSNTSSHCSYCLARCHNPMPCPDCNVAVFCNEICRTSGLSGTHGVECPLLPTLAGLNLGKNPILAHKMMTKMSFLELKELIPKLKSEINSKYPIFNGFNESGNYISKEYRTVYNLMTNAGERSVSDLFNKCARAVIMTKLMIQNPRYFVGENKEIYMPTDEDVILIGTTLFTHLASIECNDYIITELQRNIDNTQDCGHLTKAAGIYPTLSLMNHSCNPSSVTYTYGDTVAAYSLRYIPAGTEVTTSYGFHYAHNNKEERRAGLKQQFYFHCLCDSCDDNWPKLEKLPASPVLKIHGLSMPPKGSLLYEKILSSEDQKGLQQYFGIAIEKFEQSYTRIVKGDVTDKSIVPATELLEFIDRFVNLPCKMYFEVQETVRHCLSLKTSHKFFKRDKYTGNPL